ncbi:MAG: hypothetical protein J6P03_03660 [Opitutales bacterium]|nr:hypothetical protein [Opitutales bacterium]
MALEKIMRTGDAAKACLVSKRTFLKLALKLGIQPFAIRQMGPVKHFSWRVKDVERIQRIGVVRQG